MRLVIRESLRKQAEQAGKDAATRVKYGKDGVELSVVDNLIVEEVTRAVIGVLENNLA